METQAAIEEVEMKNMELQMQKKLFEQVCLECVCVCVYRCIRGIDFRCFSYAKPSDLWRNFRPTRSDEDV